jgi:retron-type reverse transcriptase
MKRVGGLWDELTSWANLKAALTTAAQGKHNRPNVAAFLLDWELLLIELQRELRGGSYAPGPYRTFLVLEPKPRKISAAPFRDRVVHHALTRVLEPVWERRFARQTFACRKGFGTHRALDAAAQASATFSHVLQCDIRKYFPSIDHEILREQLAHVIKCRPTLDLADKIIRGSNPQDSPVLWFPGDDLFTPFERRLGLPLGNQTSQFFANVYLNDFDQFILREIRPGAYCRYVDDFLLFHNDPDTLREARHRIEDFLAGLRLRLHEGKSQVRRTMDGITFLGWRIFPDRRRLVRGNVVRFRRRMREMQEDFVFGVELEEIRQRVQAWDAHAAHGDTWELRKQVFDQFPFTRGDPDS